MNQRNPQSSPPPFIVGQKPAKEKDWLLFFPGSRGMMDLFGTMMEGCR
jgi:hypothetical protein